MACGRSGPFSKASPGSERTPTVHPYAYNTKRRPICASSFGSDRSRREDRLRDQEKIDFLNTHFSEFHLSPALMSRINSNNFVTPTPVQAQAIPPALEGRDVLATAQTGT